MGRLLEAHGVTPAIEREILPNTADLRNEALRIRVAPADAVISLIYYHQQADLLKQLDNLQARSAFHGVTGSDTEESLMLAGRSALGMFVPTYESASQDFSVRFRQRWGVDPSIAADTAYDALKLIAKLTEQSEVSGLALAETARELAEYQGASGAISFLPNGMRQGRKVKLLQVTAQMLPCPNDRS